MLDPATAPLDPARIAGMLAIGLVAGIANVTAGGGSMLTVPLMILLGLPGPVANGTNRVALIAQNLVAVPTFRAGGIRGLRRLAPLIALALPGAAAGAWLGAVIPDAAFRRVLGAAVLVLAVLVIVRPRPPAGDAGPDGDGFRPLTWLAFALLGVYAGFLQAGIGFMIVFVLAGLEGLPLVRCHAFKVFVVLCLQAVALPVFAWHGLVAWGHGLVLAVGLGLGGFVGARLTLAAGERVLRVILGVAAVALAVRLLAG
ncbi:MAG: sulfite exporter TauE/SafE family protein [Acidobacteria bacterium]|nr:MAG: sulfite exporter TauE/SafE family protein [Acidobacteriota bacterium]